MKIGIIGHGTDKFTYRAELMAKATILYVLQKTLKTMPVDEKLIFISGHSPVGGIDIWAEKIAKKLDLDLDLKILIAL